MKRELISSGRRRHQPRTVFAVAGALAIATVTLVFSDPLNQNTSRWWSVRKCLVVEPNQETAVYIVRELPGSISISQGPHPVETAWSRIRKELVPGDAYAVVFSHERDAGGGARLVVVDVPEDEVAISSRTVRLRTYVIKPGSLVDPPRLLGVPSPLDLAFRSASRFEVMPGQRDAEKPSDFVLTIRRDGKLQRIKSVLHSDETVTYTEIGDSTK